jgi:Toastrack DUF4097
MNGIGRAALVVTILVAGTLVILQAQPSDGLVHRLVRGISNVATDAVGSVTGQATHDQGASSVRSDESGAQEQQAGEFTWSGTVDSGDAIEIKGVNGSVFAELSSGNSIEVVAVKTARRSDPKRVTIEVVEHEDGVTLCAVYPSRSRKENYCGPGDKGRNNVRDNDVSVAFYVKVPARTMLRARTVNGDVEIVDLESDVEASTVNGSVEVTTTGFAHASTVNGSIAAAMGVIDAQGMRFSTVNGSIDLDIPNDIDADIDASWVNGGIESDLAMELVGRISKRSASGSFGEGGPDIELRTVNGSIRIR